ncbi:FG-GAP repeat domain-containing protein [Streptomyces sp. NPDC015130]|uniref:FG-GAP repeat domain-containing protein n=1 Tax=Streptomyces sp. NPDC015130 TaxID=3364940 RepID=UPI003702807F
MTSSSSFTYTRTRAPRRHLAAAVVAVLAVTAGTALTAVPAAHAAPVAVQGTQDRAEAMPTLPNGSRMISAGTTGFLTTTPNYAAGTFETIWTNYETGENTPLNARDTNYAGNASDIVFENKQGSLTHWIRDMAHPSNVLTGISMNNGTYVRAVLGSALLVSTENRTTGAVTVDLLRNTNGSTKTTPVTGLPTDVKGISATVTAPGTATLRYSTGSGDTFRHHVAALDVFTGELLETFPTLPSNSAFASATHWSWIESTGNSRGRLAVAPRGGGAAPTYTDLGSISGGSGMQTSIVGDWVTYSLTHYGNPEFPSPLYPLMARPVGGGEPVRLLDHVQSATTAPDGSLVVRGGTVAHGEGVYRIAPNGENGAPTVEMVATTNTPTALGLVSHDVPATVDLDKNGGRAAFTFLLTHSYVQGSFTLRHVRTGRSEKIDFMTSGGSTSTGNKVTVNWSGQTNWTAAFNGDYTWEFRAMPNNGIGPELRKSGTFKVVRKTALHDYNDNGTPDLLSRDPSGRLWRDDVLNIRTEDGVPASDHKLLGSGWNTYTQIEAVGNVAGGPVSDVVARDRDGALWLYLGKGDGTFAARTKIGTGWNTYNKITGGSDVNGDGWADLLATDTTGVLWVYKGTGNWRAPYGVRTKVGGGWGSMNQITAVGNLGGTAHGDLLARDTAGVLWLYPGTGGTALGSRVRVGGGWGAYPHLVGSGDFNGDGRNDVMAYGPSGSFYYPGTGNLSAPLGSRAGIPVFVGGSPDINLIA